MRASTWPRSPTRSRGEIDRDPAILLRWRGCEAEDEIEPAAPMPCPLVMPEDAWEAGPLPEPRPLRPLPTGAVLKRLGPSGLRVGGDRPRRAAAAGIRIVRRVAAPLVLDAVSEPDDGNWSIGVRPCTEPLAYDLAVSNTSDDGLKRQPPDVPTLLGLL